MREITMASRSLKMGTVLTAGEVERVYAHISQDDNAVILDCSATETINGSGLLALVMLWKDLRTMGKEIVILDPSDDLRAMLRALKADTIVEFTWSKTVS